MASELAAKRLRKEYIAIKKKPIENIIAVPLDTNILDWHYVITGTKESPYYGGYYHGKLKFPPEYPLKPPSVLMFTENGRFKTNRRLCLSMSDFHPETWNPMWSVSSILTGLYSFMLESAPTLGSIETTENEKRRLAKKSLEMNCKNPVFCQCFPELVELFAEQQKELARLNALKKAVHGGNWESNSSLSLQPHNDMANGLEKLKNRLEQWNHSYVAAGLFLICALVLMLFQH